eukprot:486451-Alexandrium_andersonii.AAC.1
MLHVSWHRWELGCGTPLAPPIARPGCRGAARPCDGYPSPTRPLPAGALLRVVRGRSAARI